MPPKSSSIAITPETHKHLIEKRNLLDQDRDEEKAELQSLISEEKDPTGSSVLDEARKRINFIEGRIAEIDEFLANAVIVDTDTTSETTVAVGKRVVLRMHKCGTAEHEQIEVVIDGFGDRYKDGTSVVMPDSPVGAAILGAETGDKKQYRSPSGATIQLVIVSVSSH